MKDIKGYEGIYAITSCGKVWSYKNHKFKTPTQNPAGYLVVHLSKKGINKHFLLHRLVAEAYIPNPGNLETVDHIDGDTHHNYVNNLQWLTRGENARKGNSKPVAQYTKEGAYVQSFPSALDAAKAFGAKDGSHIAKACRNERNFSYGFVWKYI